MSVTLSSITFIPLLLMFSMSFTLADSKSSEQLHNNTTIPFVSLVPSVPPVPSVPSIPSAPPVSPQKDASEEIGTRSGYDFVRYQTEDIAYLIRLRNEFKSKQTPAETAEIFAKVEKMKKKIEIQKSMKFPNYIMQTLHVLDNKCTALKNDVKKKLLFSLNEGIDNWLEDLKQLKVGSVDKAIRRKVGALEESLRKIQIDLEKLDSINDLDRIKI